MSRNEQIIRPGSMAEANSICVDLTERKIDFVLHFNAAGISVRILSANVSAV